MLMYDLLEYSKNYRKTTGSLWNYYRNEPSDPLSSNSESFKYKTSVTGNTYNTDENITYSDGNEVDNPEYDANKVGKNETEVVIPLKYQSNFRKSLNIPLINCELELILTWSKNCILADITERAFQDNNPAIVAPTGLEFKITNTTLHVPVVSLSKENDRLLEQLKSGFKRTVKWNKYSSQMIIQPQNNNLNCLIDPAFTNVNRLFVLSFPRNNNTDSRDSFSHYCVPNVEIKDFNVLIDGKSFFDLPLKMKKQSMKKILK